MKKKNNSLTKSDRIGKPGKARGPVQRDARLPARPSQSQYAFKLLLGTTCECETIQPERHSRAPTRLTADLQGRVDLARALHRESRVFGLPARIRFVTT